MLQLTKIAFGINIILFHARSTRIDTACWLDRIQIVIQAHKAPNFFRVLSFTVLSSERKLTCGGMLMGDLCWRISLSYACYSASASCRNFILPFSCVWYMRIRSTKLKYSILGEEKKLYNLKSANVSSYFISLCWAKSLDLFSSSYGAQIQEECGTWSGPSCICMSVIYRLYLIEK